MKFKIEDVPVRGGKLSIKAEIVDACIKLRVGQSFFVDVGVSRPSYVRNAVSPLNRSQAKYVVTKEGTGVRVGRVA